jgi:hypothetical protein
MEAEYVQALSVCPNVQRMLRGIPQNAWLLFLPPRAEDLAAFEERIKQARRWEKKRQRVMMIQRSCGFSLRPNEYLSEVETRARIFGLRYTGGEDRRKPTGDAGGWPNV